MDASHRKLSQVHASRGQTESQVTTSFQLAITYDSVWPGLIAILEINCANSIDRRLEGRKKNMRVVKVTPELQYSLYSIDSL